MNIRDFLVPEPGLYGVVYNYLYTSDRLNNEHGNKVSSITINTGPGPGVTLDVNPHLDAYGVSPALIWVSPWDLGGLNYGAYVSPSLSSSTVEAAVSSLRGSGRNARNTWTIGVGDLFVQPVWLGLTLTNFDFALGYGFYAPVGRYKTETFTESGQSFTTTSPDNLGMGFWTHQFQGAAAWYPWADRRLAVVGALTYEINSAQQDIDFTPGQHLTLNWGASQYVPLTKNQNLLLEVGPAGYDNWQITDDSGSAARNPTQHTQVHGVGAQIGLTYDPWNAELNVHAFYQYSSDLTLQGESFGLSFAIKF
jgi:hypothetical protein